MAKTTAIRAPTTDPVNHQIVLRQLKEASETASRLRGNARDSFAQVGELLDAGIVRFVDGKLVAPSPSSLPPTVVPSTRQIKTGGSIQGGGSLAADLSLELAGDAGSPGNNMLYGTNATGVKGWYTQPAAAATLASLADVSVSGLTNGQVLAYNSTASKWENQAAGGGSLSSLTDVLLTSPSNGQSLVYNSTAAKWENQTVSSGGGSGGSFTGNSGPDTPPASPTSYDDEFSAGTTVDTSGTRFSGANPWVWFNQGAATGTLDQGCLQLTDASKATSGNQWRLLVQPVPSGSWKFRAKLKGVVLGNYQNYGLVLYNNANGHIINHGPSFNSGSGGAINLGDETFTNFTTYSGNLFLGNNSALGSAANSWAYYEIDYDGASTLTFLVSATGLDGDFTLVGTTTVATFLGGITHIGLGTNPANTTYVSTMWVDWFRRVDSGGGQVGGAASAASYGEPGDVPPASPTAWDDEFSSSTLGSKWTLHASDGVASLINGALKLKSGASGALCSVTQVPPSAPWTFQFKIAPGVSTGAPCIMVNNSSTNKMIPIVAVYDSGNTGVIWIRLTNNGYSAAPTYSSTVYNGTPTGWIAGWKGWVYYQLHFDGTTFTLSWSPTGLPDTWEQVATETASTWLGGAPTDIGLCCWNADVPIYMDWIRRTA